MRLTQGYTFETLTVSSTALGLSSGSYDPQTASAPQAWRVVLTIEGGPVRVRWDGTDPTASVGHLLEPGTSFSVEGETDIRRIRLIRASATDASVAVTYER